jgi:hypothetical protein
MANFRIKTTLFCSISKEAKWQDWLVKISPDLGQELLAHVKNSRSCRANSQKMREVLDKLRKRGAGPALIQFLKTEFPFAIEEVLEKQVPQKTVRVETVDNSIFEFYDPHLLSFPQKMILRNDDINVLRQSVVNFCIGKVGVDYLIIGNTAYIEYFKLKYDTEAGLIKSEEREIYKYRISVKIPQDRKEMSKDNL